VAAWSSARSGCAEALVKTMGSLLKVGVELVSSGVLGVEVVGRVAGRAPTGTRETPKALGCGWR